MYLKHILAWTGIVVAVAVVFGFVWVYLLSPAPRQTTGPLPTGTLPVSNSIPAQSGSFTGTTSATSAAQTITIAERGQAPVTVPDFIHNGVTLADSANPGRYLLAGDLGYCPVGGGPCGTASTTDFNIFYDSTGQYFLIALTQEPIGAARLAAQQFLLQTLGITEAQACALTYYLGTTVDVNPVYAGKNLGFSFCPGATVLPQ